MNKRITLNENWLFTEKWSDALLRPSFDCAGCAAVRLPHTCKETPYNYFSEQIYQMVCGYRRILRIPADWQGKKLLLTVEAAGHYAQVYFNGALVGEHRCGYTAFQIDLTAFAEFGKDNVLAIKVDSSETLDQPPFGFVIDYMTYGGLYRGVYLEVKEQTEIADLFARPLLRLGGEPAVLPLKNGMLPEGLIESDVTLRGPLGGCALRQSLTLKGGDEILASQTTQIEPGKPGTTVRLSLAQVRLWDVDDPFLYELRTELLQNGAPIEARTDVIGFRDAKFTADGFFLNGKRVQIRGLDRHQCYPYFGYAAPASMQRTDADILKNELALNAVRTSHYPQSHAFIDRCDELGLLVFTEIPGWQHIGGEAWKKQAIENVREMVVQYRNHPSIILWGVRINESKDDDAFYAKTNAVAHELDPTRQTGGVRYIKKSHLLEDVYTYNDFLHDGITPGCEERKNVTPDLNKGYLISEYAGHMFPTKMFDSEYHLLEHLLRHARVLDDVAKQPEISGSFGWCMFDYNTHKDFGSGDRICYHGVMDMYRNPKPAAYLYAALGKTEELVLYLTSQMDIGEHPTGNVGRVYIVTNADSVKMYKNGLFLREYFPADSPYKNLAHGPILVEDYIGNRLETEEGFDHKKAELVKEILNYAAVYGFNRLPRKISMKAGKAAVRYGLKFEDAYELFGKYIGDWGGSATTYRFEAVKDGKVVKVLEKTATEQLVPEIRADRTVLTERETYDMAAVRVRVCDQNGNALHFYNGVMNVAAEGPIEIVGPTQLMLRGGCGGTYVKSTGRSGKAALVFTSDQMPEQRIGFEIYIEREKEEV